MAYHGVGDRSNFDQDSYSGRQARPLPPTLSEGVYSRESTSSRCFRPSQVVHGPIPPDSLQQQNRLQRRPQHTQATNQVQRPSRTGPRTASESLNQKSHQRTTTSNLSPDAQSIITAAVDECFSRLGAASPPSRDDPSAPTLASKEPLEIEVEDVKFADEHGPHDNVIHFRQLHDGQDKISRKLEVVCARTAQLGERVEQAVTKLTGLSDILKNFGPSLANSCFETMHESEGLGTAETATGNDRNLDMDNLFGVA